MSALEDINDATSERVLPWAQSVEAQRAQKKALFHAHTWLYQM